MQLNDIYVNRLGVLKHLSLDNLPALSVIHGGNGSGKTTLARFLRDILLSADSLTTQHPDETNVGSIQISESHHSWTLSRSMSVTGNEQTTVQYDGSSERSATRKPGFPDWISDRVFQEILCPGYQEAEQFTLLTKLCLETGESMAAKTEIQRAKTAIAQAVRERQGTELEPGLSQQIDDLERQRDELNNDLRSLRENDSSVSDGMSSIQEPVSAQSTRSLLIHDPRELNQNKETTDAEHRPEEPRQKNLLALNQRHLQALLAELTVRRDQWRRIRNLIDQETRAVQTFGAAAINRSAHSVRAVVSRLEERMRQRKTEETERWHSNVEQEIAALCQFVTQQQEGSQAFERRFESQYGSEASNCIHRIESLLQDQILGIQEELNRAEDILSDSVQHEPPACESLWHCDYRRAHDASNASLHSSESERPAVNDRHSSAPAESPRNAHESVRLSSCSDILSQKLSPIPSLEEIDDLRARLAEVEARAELLVSHRDILLRTEQLLEQVVERLTQRQLPKALEIATPWLQRLTSGECVRILPDSDRSELLVETTTSPQPLRIAELSLTTQHQLALTLRLALLQVHSTTSQRMPFIIDDVFITSDDERDAAAADLLQELAVDGQQIVMLTCQNDIRELLASRGAAVYNLPAASGSAPISVVESASTSMTNTSLTSGAFDSPVRDVPDEVISNGQDDSHWLFYLEPEHPVSDLSGIEISELNGCAAADIGTIDQLLTCSIMDVKERIQGAGFFMTEARLRELQIQAVLAVCVPMLRQRDAELLVSAGIDNTRQLARLRPEAIFDLIQRFQQSDSGTRFLRSGRTIDRQQAISWNRWALHARTVDRARVASFARMSQASGSVGIQSSSQRTPTRHSSRRNRPSKNQESLRRVRARVSDNNRRREIRSARRRQRKISGPVNECRSVNRETELRFCLSLSSDVDAAPSIGAKTAARLARVGIGTVQDLLESDTDTLVTLLDDHQITAPLIEQWKSQSALVCTIPKLRGLDAQILVACGRKDADEIVNLSPEQLFSVIQPFCDTIEGERIIQDNKKPDLKEVSNWISWARRSRPLKAA
ncbi:MAG: DUF4332 domain-containing protein [Fuerstiella sp.]|nr:DUF4332 domain-containing protein [Fuerstiella sp.]